MSAVEKLKLPVRVAMGMGAEEEIWVLEFRGLQELSITVGLPQGVEQRDWPGPDGTAASAQDAAKHGLPSPRNQFRKPLLRFGIAGLPFEQLFEYCARLGAVAVRHIGARQVEIEDLFVGRHLDPIAESGDRVLHPLRLDIEHAQVVDGPGVIAFGGNGVLETRYRFRRVVLRRQDESELIGASCRAARVSAHGEASAPRRRRAPAFPVPVPRSPARRPNRERARAPVQIPQCRRMILLRGSRDLPGSPGVG